MCLYFLYLLFNLVPSILVEILSAKLNNWAYSPFEPKQQSKNWSNMRTSFHPDTSPLTVSLTWDFLPRYNHQLLHLHEKLFRKVSKNLPDKYLTSDWLSQFRMTNVMHLWSLTLHLQNKCLLSNIKNCWGNKTS